MFIISFSSRPTLFPGSLSSVGMGRREAWEQDCLKTFACDLAFVGRCWSLLDLRIKSLGLNFTSLVFLYLTKASFFYFLQFLIFFLCVRVCVSKISLRQCSFNQAYMLKCNNDSQVSAGLSTKETSDSRWSP